MPALRAPEETWTRHIGGQGWNCNINTTAHLWLRNWDACKVKGSSVFRSSKWSPSSVDDCLWWNESCRKRLKPVLVVSAVRLLLLRRQKTPKQISSTKGGVQQKGQDQNSVFRCKHGNSWTKSSEDLHPLWERKLKVHIYGIYIYICSPFLTTEVS